MAQPAPAVSTSPSAPVPVDGGLLTLGVMGAVYGAKKAYSKFIKK